MEFAGLVVHLVVTQVEERVFAAAEEVQRQGVWLGVGLVAAVAESAAVGAGWQLGAVSGTGQHPLEAAESTEQSGGGSNTKANATD